MRAFRHMQTTSPNERVRRAQLSRINRLYRDRVIWVSWSRTAVWIGPDRYNDDGTIARKPSAFPRSRRKTS